jgi:hypothetical protein
MAAVCYAVGAGSMTKWSIIQTCEAIVSEATECIIYNITQAEDYTTETVTISVLGSDHNLFVRGFRTDQKSPSENHNQIEMVEVSTGYSDGDMPNDPVLSIAHGKVKAAMMRLGHSVVNSLDPYF